MNNEQALVPDLRFGKLEDCGPLRMVGFDELFLFSQGKNIKQNEAAPHFRIPCVRYGELYHMYSQVIIEVKNRTNLDPSELKFSQGNEILLPSAGEDALDIGSASALLQKGVAIGRTINVLQPKNPKEYDHRFVSYYINSVLRKPISQLARGASISNVYNSDLKELKIRLPPLPEQVKIAEFLMSLDRLIELHQRKHDKLVALKQAMLQKMFPQDGATTPEIRFKGFHTEWTTEPVSSLLLEKNIQAPKCAEYPLMAFVAYRGVAAKGDRYNREFLVSDEANKKYKRTDLGDFIYSSNNLETGSIGLNNYGSASISPVYSIFAPTEVADSDFVGRLLTRKEIIREMVRWRQGVVYGQWRIHESDFLQIEVCFPSKSEQVKIGAYFRNLDELIFKHSAQIEKLKNIKFACLEKMFV